MNPVSQRIHDGRKYLLIAGKHYLLATICAFIRYLLIQAFNSGPKIFRDFRESGPWGERGGKRGPRQLVLDKVTQEWSLFFQSQTYS